MNLKELKAHCQELAYAGQDYLAIKRELDSRDLPASDRDAALKAVDDYIIRYEYFQQEKQKSLQKMMLGMLLVFIGVGSWLTGIADGGISKSLVVTLILLGANMTRTAWKAYGQPIDDDYFRKRKFKSGDMRRFYGR